MCKINFYNNFNKSVNKECQHIEGNWHCELQHIYKKDQNQKSTTKQIQQKIQNKQTNKQTNKQGKTTEHKQVINTGVGNKREEYWIKENLCINKRGVWIRRQIKRSHFKFPCNKVTEDISILPRCFFIYLKSLQQYEDDDYISF